MHSSKQGRRARRGKEVGRRGGPLSPKGDRDKHLGSESGPTTRHGTSGVPSALRVSSQESSPEIPAQGTRW